MSRTAKEGRGGTEKSYVKLSARIGRDVSRRHFYATPPLRPRTRPGRQTKGWKVSGVVVRRPTDCTSTVERFRGLTGVLYFAPQRMKWSVFSDLLQVSHSSSSSTYQFTPGFVSVTILVGTWLRNSGETRFPTPELRLVHWVLNFSVSRNNQR